MSRLFAFVSRVLARRFAKPMIVFLGVFLASTSLGSGLAADDYFHELLLRGDTSLPGVHGRKWDLFVFATGEPSLARQQMDSGIVGWWADPELKISYFRPLAAATHVFDHDFLGMNPVLMHAHSLLWFAAGLAAIGWLYSRFLSPAMAAGALFLYAVDDAHGFPISWIANRNALIAVALGVPVIVLHDMARREGRRFAAFAAPALLFVALLAGESATAVCAYLFAHAVCFEKGTWKERVKVLIPYAAVVVAWRALYGGLGYGTRNSGLSIDPVLDPLGYVVAVLDRLPAMLAGQFAFPPSDLWEFYPVVNAWLPWLMRAVVLITLIILAVLLRPRLKEDATTRFWAIGTVLSALPGCAQVPHDRLLMFAGVGAMPLVAWLLSTLLEDLGASSFLRRAGYVAAFAFLFFVHVPWAMWALPLRSNGAADVERMLGRADKTIPEDETVVDQTVILANPPADAFVGYITMERAAQHRFRPKHLHWLATGGSPVTIERVDERTLRVTPQAGFLATKSEWMQRSPLRPMRAGYTSDLSTVTFRIERESPDGRAATALATFRAPLESQLFRFLKWTDDGYRPFVLPKIGESVTLPRIDFFKLDDP